MNNNNDPVKLPAQSVLVTLVVNLLEVKRFVASSLHNPIYKRSRTDVVLKSDMS